jgi:DNA repair exonuclease SbcCD ATPase subunit
MEQGTLFFILKLLPYVAICSTVAFLLGYFFSRPKSTKSSATSAHAPTNDESARIKKLQEKLQSSETAAKSLRQQLESLKADSITKTEHATLQSGLDALQEKWNTEKKRVAALEADVRKAQDTAASLNSRLNADAKAQNSRVIQLENELSQAREALNLAGTAPAYTAPDLQAELDRAKDTVANAMRLVGETRKRESALQQELESLKKRVESGSTPRPSQLISTLPFGTLETTAPTPSAADRAREEVARLNAKRDAELQTIPVEVPQIEPILEEQPVLEEQPIASEEPAAEKSATVEPTTTF